MKTKFRVLTVILILTLTTVLYYSINGYFEQKKVLMELVDTKLLEATYILGEMLGQDYHDDLNDNAFSQEEYDRIIVDRNNKLCKELHLQYLWSCMIVGDELVFTSSTSPSLDIAQKDHAEFFEVHRNPEAFDEVFSRMETTYSSFQNEWGQGRMLLVPYKNKSDKKYCIGASISIDHIAGLHNKVIYSLILGLITVVLILVIASILSNHLRRSIKELSNGLEKISSGDFDHEIILDSKTEIGNLAVSVNQMSANLKKITASRDELNKEIEERKRAEQEREILMQKLQESNRQLENFAYAASHDLQEPLRKVISFVDLLAKNLENTLDEKGIKYMNYITSGAARMQRLIQDLLTFSRLSTKENKLIKTDLNKLLNEVCGDLSMMISENKAEIEIDRLPELVVDKGQFRTLYQNLISNAIKFRGEKIPRIRISAREEKEDWLLTISDNGIGIAQEFADRVFVIFQRLHSNEDYPGTGLGLAIVERIIFDHKGQIWFESEIGAGTTFYIDLPSGNEA